MVCTEKANKCGSVHCFKSHCFNCMTHNCLDIIEDIANGTIIVIFFKKEWCKWFKRTVFKTVIMSAMPE